MRRSIPFSATYAAPPLPAWRHHMTPLSAPVCGETTRTKTLGPNRHVGSERGVRGAGEENPPSPRGREASRNERSEERITAEDRCIPWLVCWRLNAPLLAGGVGGGRKCRFLGCVPLSPPCDDAPEYSYVVVERHRTAACSIGLSLGASVGVQPTHRQPACRLRGARAFACCTGAVAAEECSTITRNVPFEQGQDRARPRRPTRFYPNLAR